MMIKPCRNLLITLTLCLRTAVNAVRISATTRSGMQVAQHGLADGYSGSARYFVQAWLAERGQTRNWEKRCTLALASTVRTVLYLVA